MRTLRALCAVGAVAALLAACSSTGDFNRNVDLTKYHAVYVSKNISVFDQRYLPPVLSALRQDGFKIVDTAESPDTLTLKFATDTANLNHYRVAIQLWTKDQVAIDAEAKNSGWGNLLASDSAVRDLVSRAVAQMQKQIRKSEQSSY